MFVAEYVSNLFTVDEKEKLHFDYNDDEILKDLKSITNQPIKFKSQECKPLSSKTESQTVNNSKKISKIVDIRTRILDSDDDEECDDNETKAKREDEVFFIIFIIL